MIFVWKVHAFGVLCASVEWFRFVDGFLERTARVLQIWILFRRILNKRPKLQEIADVFSTLDIKKRHYILIPGTVFWIQAQILI